VLSAVLLFFYYDQILEHFLCLGKGIVSWAEDCRTAITA
jgi:hypothetical protein